MGESDGAGVGLRALAKILDLREEFLIDLLADPDDWSFVVKSHALLETVLCTLLAMRLRKQDLEAVFAEEIEMKARIELTKALVITTSEDRRAMHALGKLRNKLVHNARDTSFTFDEYFRNRDAKRNFSETFGHGWSDPVGGIDPPVPRTEFVASHPKLAIFESTLKIAMYVASELSNIQTELALQELRGVAAPPPEIGSGDISNT